MVHILLKAGLENFKHYFTSVWDECNCAVVRTFFFFFFFLNILWHCLSLGLEWKVTFSSPVVTVEFSKFVGILSAALSQHHLLDVPYVQAVYRKGRGSRDQTANICWIIEKAREFQKKNLLLLYWLCQNLDYVDHNKLWKSLQDTRIPDHLICLLRNLYAGQEATVRTGHGTTDCFQIGKGVRQGCILSPCLFSLYAEYVMRNAGLEETQAGIKTARRNIKTSDMQMTSPLWQKVKRN